MRLENRRTKIWSDGMARKRKMDPNFFRDFLVAQIFTRYGDLIF